MRKIGAVLASASLAMGLIFLGSYIGGTNAMMRKAKALTKPNIILVLTDDQDLRSLAHMPRVKAKLVDRGTTFENGLVTDALCCPSRASILRGQYPHNHGVEGNIEPSGHDAFRDLGEEDSTIATWLHDQGGYRTALIGKYMNAYDQLYIPPGWDYWFATHGSAKYRNYNDNGTLVDYPNYTPSTDRLAKKAYAYLERTKDDPRPFFLYLSTEDPHSPATPPARYKGTFSDEPLPKPPSFNERDVSDKPSWVRQHPLLSDAKVDGMKSHYRERLESLQAVDEMVSNLVDTLKAQGKMRNTYIVFTSDNGYHIGQHRLGTSKMTAYEEDIRVPYVVRGPGVPAGRTLDHMVLNNDLAPTFAQLGGVSTPSFVDGRSLVPLLGSAPPPVSEWRDQFLVEQHSLRAKEPPPYKALRTRYRTYVRYSDGERELYNLSKDPYELNSRHRTADSALLSSLNTRLSTLNTCVGDSCQTAEGR
jgi:N-acetylglucosamine-6-sulfatase